MKLLLFLFLVLFLFNSCKKKSSSCNQEILSDEEKLWMQPYPTNSYKSFDYINGSGIHEVEKVINISYRSVHFSEEEKCGTDEKQAESGVTIGGPINFDFYCSGGLTINYKNGNHKSYSITNFPFNGSSYEMTIDSANTDSTFVYKLFYSKSKGIVKYIKRNGDAFTLNQ